MSLEQAKALNCVVTVSASHRFHAWVLDFFDVGNLGYVRVNAVSIYFCEAGVAVVGGGTAS